MNIMVKQAIKFLVNQAERDTDPLPYAYVVLDHIGDDDVARQLVSDPDYLTNIGRIDARVLNNSAIRQWFEKLREAVLQTLNESDSVGENVTTTGGLDAPKSITGTENETTG